MVPRVSGRICRDDSGGEVFDACYVDADARHDALHEFRGPGKDVGARALRGPEAGQLLVVKVGGGGEVLLRRERGRVDVGEDVGDVEVHCEGVRV